MINTNMSLHHYRHDVILLMSLVAALVLFLLVFLGVIVTWRLRKKLGEFSLYTSGGLTVYYCVSFTAT